MSGLHADKLSIAKDAIDRVFTDTKVEPEVTYHNLTDLKEGIEVMLEALEEDMENARREQEKRDNED